MPYRTYSHAQQRGMFILKCQFACVVFIVVLLPSFHCDTDSISVLKSAYEEDEQKAVEKQ